MSDHPKDSWLDRPIFGATALKREVGLYALIILICLASRLAMLGYRVQSHDESLHCQYSWYLYAGRGYEHNPMMHGPADYHFVALTYFLFGDSDFTARLPIALMGTVLVALPYLLRRYLGRGGALATSFLLLISPSIAYYSRYIRHDIPALLWAVVLIWALFRYLEEGRNRHLYILAAALSLLYATKEVAPIYTMIVAVFLSGVFLVRALSQPWERYRAETAFLVALAVTVVGLITLAIGLLVGSPVEGVPLPVWGLAGGLFALLAMVVAVVAILYGLRGQLHTYRSFDLIILIGTLSLPFAAPLAIKLVSRLGAVVVGRYPVPEMAPAFWSQLANHHMLNYYAPDIYISGVILALVIAVSIAIGLAWDWRRWPVAAAIHTAIFLVLFTTVFTNGAGIATGWVGSVGYWLEQQGVRRGDQPWYYYLVILPFYDFLPLLGALIAPLYLAARGLVHRIANRAADELPGMRTLFVPFLFVWTLLAWFGYSYAGEKMPWLTVHLAVPMILLTGWLLGRLLKAVGWPQVWQQRGWLLFLLLPALVAALTATVGALTHHPFGGLESVSYTHLTLPTIYSV